MVALEQRWTEVLVELQSYNFPKNNYKYNVFNTLEHYVLFELIVTAIGRILNVIYLSSLHYFPIP